MIDYIDDNKKSVYQVLKNTNYFKDNKLPDDEHSFSTSLDADDDYAKRLYDYMTTEGYDDSYDNFNKYYRRTKSASNGTDNTGVTDKVQTNRPTTGNITVTGAPTHNSTATDKSTKQTNNRTSSPVDNARNSVQRQTKQHTQSNTTNANAQRTQTSNENKQAHNTQTKEHRISDAQRRQMMIGNIAEMQQNVQNIVNFGKQRVRNMQRHGFGLGTGGVKKDGYEYNAKTKRMEQAYLTPNGTRTTDKQIAQAEAEDLKKSKNQHLALQLDKKSINDLQKSSEGVIAQLWKEAERQYSADVNKNNKEYAGRPWYYAEPGERTVDIAVNRQKNTVSRFKNFDLKKMAEKVWAKTGKNLTERCYKLLANAYKGAPGAQLYASAKEMARQLSDNAVYKYAVGKNAPKSALDYLGRMIQNNNLLYSLNVGAARTEAGTTGDLLAREQAMNEYGEAHPWQRVTGTVLGMASDPTTYLGGYAGGMLAKGTLGLTGRLLFGRLANGAGARLVGSTLGGRVLSGVAGGVGNMATYEGVKEVESQLVHGGHINPETGQNEGYSVGQMLKAAGHGAIIGSATGVVSPLLGNVADKVVKATANTAGKIGTRAGELALSTVAEGTIFATPEWIENAKLDDFNPNKKSNWDIWSNSMGTMLGFKAMHAVKTAPKVIADLRPIKNPRTVQERNHNRMKFLERLRDRLNASPKDLAFTNEEREELAQNGYGGLASLFATKEKQKRTNPIISDVDVATFENPKGVEVSDEGRAWLKNHPEIDGYDKMEEFMQDANISQSTRAKAYYIFTGRHLPMGTVMGCTKETDENGNIYIKSITSYGEVVTNKRVANEEQAQRELNKIMRQVELNTIDVGESAAEKRADDTVWNEAVQYASPGADPEIVRKNYQSALAGDENAQKQFSDMFNKIDEFYERNGNIADNQRPEFIRKEISQKTGVDVDEAIRKMPEKRTEEEQKAVQEYAERLYPDNKRETETSDRVGIEGPEDNNPVPGDNPPKEPDSPTTNIQQDNTEGETVREEQPGPTQTGPTDPVQAEYDRQKQAVSDELFTDLKNKQLTYTDPQTGQESLWKATYQGRDYYIVKISHVQEGIGVYTLYTLRNEQGETVVTEPLDLDLAFDDPVPLDQMADQALAQRGITPETISQQFDFAQQHNPQTKNLNIGDTYTSPDGTKQIIVGQDDNKLIVRNAHFDTQQQKYVEDPKSPTRELTPEEVATEQDAYYDALDQQTPPTETNNNQAPEEKQETNNTPDDPQQPTYTKPSQNPEPFGPGDQLTFYVDNKPIQAEVVQPENADGVVIETSQRVNGHKVYQYTREELDQLTTPPETTAEPTKRGVQETTENVPNEGENVQQPMTDERLLVQEQQHKPTEHNNETNTPETPNETTPQSVSPTDNKVNQTQQSETTDNTTPQTDLTQTDPQTAWNTLLRQTDQDHNMAREVAAEMLADKQKELEQAQQQKPTQGKTPEEKIQAHKQHKAHIDQLQNEVNKWQQILQQADKKQEPSESNNEPNEETLNHVAHDNNKVEETHKAFNGKYTLSTERADNGELFVQKEDGSTALVDIPKEIFDRIGINTMPFKMTESMALHVFNHHKAEGNFKKIDDAVDFVVSTIKNADHVRLGRDNTYIFSVENNRNKTGRRAIAVVIDSKSGKFLGVKTSGYEGIQKLRERPLLWERSAEPAPEDVATPTITTIEPQQSDERTSHAKGQSNNLSTDKDTQPSPNTKENPPKTNNTETETHQLDETIARFVKGKSQLQKGRIEKLLNTRKNYDGKIMTPAEMLANKVNQGYVISAFANNGKIEYAINKIGDKAYSVLSKTEYDFAQFLGAKENKEQPLRRATIKSRMQNIRKEISNDDLFFTSRNGVKDYITKLNSLEKHANLLKGEAKKEYELLKEYKQLDKELQRFEDKSEAKQTTQSHTLEKQETKEGKEEKQANENNTETEATKPTDDKDKEAPQEKIDDVGEKIEGARKDALKKLAESIAQTTENALVAMPFSKAFKRPNLKKAVEDGVLREEDALFAQAVMSAYLSRKKPLLSKSRSSYERSRSETAIKNWAHHAYSGIEKLKKLFSLSPEERDAFMREEMDRPAYDPKEIEKRKQNLTEWNPGKVFNGTCYPINPIKLWHDVYTQLGYEVGTEVPQLFSGVVPATGYASYNLIAANGSTFYPTRPTGTYDAVVDEIVYQIKVANADADTDHPKSVFGVVGSGKRKTKPSGKWGVVTQASLSASPHKSIFNSKEEAKEFAKAYLLNGGKKVSKYRFSSAPIEEKEFDGYDEYAVVLRRKNVAKGTTTDFKLKHYGSKEEAIAAIDAEHDELNELANKELAKAKESKGASAKKPICSIEVYTEDGKSWKYGIVLSDKYAPKTSTFNTMPYYLAQGFDTRKDAQAYLDAHKEEIEDKAAEVDEARKNFSYFSGNETRVGKDYRNGKDVTAEQFREQFGFRGVQFGNWTNQRDRQEAVNQAFDAFMDLSRILGVSPKALSLNGELGIAFGARGGGQALAHYEPSQVVINLTKTKGAGALAHEWWHALDNYFARQGNVAMGFVTQSISIEMRNELRQAFNTLIGHLEKSSYNERSKKRGASYWGTPIEETARMFEQWVNDQLSQRGEKSPFLTDADPYIEERYAESNYKWYKFFVGENAMPYEEYKQTPQALNGLVYLTRDELQTFGKDLKQIFDTIQEQVDETTGKTLMYHKGEVVQPLTPEETALRDTVIEQLRENGMEVITDVDEGQALLDLANGNSDLKLEAKRKRALETVTIADLSTNKATGISSADGAKIQNNLETLAESYQKLPNKAKGFITDLSQALKLKQHEASNYGTFETSNGKQITIRVSNHNARVSFFDKNGEEDGISIVISNHKNKGVLNDGNAHVVEYFYPKQSLQRAEGKPLADIIRSVSNALNSGEFKDTTGLAERQEVNTNHIREHRVYHGSGADFDHFDHSHMGEGEGAQAYGWGTYVTEVEGIGRAYAKQAAKFPKGIVNNIIPYLGNSSSAINAIMSPATHKKTLLRLINKAIYVQEALLTGTTLSPMIENARIALGKLKAAKDLLTRERQPNLYTVEIPDDTGKNYLDWDGKLPKRFLDRVNNTLSSKGKKVIEQLYPSRVDGKLRGEDLYDTLHSELGSQKAASMLLKDAGFVGVKVIAQRNTGGNKEGKMNYVIFNEKDAQIIDHVRFFRSGDGEAYGFTVGGKIYIDPRIANAETPVHEYAHLWASALKSGNTKEWQNVVGLMKDTPVWEEVKQRYPELETDDEIADEVIATYSGRRGAERLREEARRVADGDGSVLDKADAIGALERVKKALKRFWKGVCDFLHIHYTSAEEVADRVMKDLLDGVDPRMANKRDRQRVTNQAMQSSDNIRFQFVGEKGASQADHEEEVSTRLDNLALAREMEEAKKDAKSIKMATGWERGADGKWRYEIPDISYRVNGDAGYKKARARQPWSKELDALSDRIFDGEELSAEEHRQFDELAEKERDFKTTYLNREKPHLADWVENDELFKAYPRLKRTKILFTDQLPNNVAGKYIRNQDIIAINPVGVNDIAPTIAHEIQHIIQHIEGFARGGNPDMTTLKKSKEYKDWQKMVDKARKPSLKEGDLQNTLDAHYEELDRLNKKINKYFFESYDSRNADDRNLLTTMKERLSEIEREIVNLSDELEKERRKRGSHVKNVLFMEKAILNALYRRLAGEVESRNVEKRMAMTPEERRASLAAETEDVSRKDQIFLYGGEYANQERQDTPTPSTDQKDMADTALSMARQFGTDVDIITDPAQITDPDPIVQQRKRKAKGWYDTRTGKVTINLSAHKDQADIQQTMLHETVGHKGMRALIGKETFGDFLDNIYNHASQPISMAIDHLANKKHTSKRTATEEYIAHLAESGFNDRQNIGLWQQIKQWFSDMLAKAKIALNFHLSDRELRYLLWKSYKQQTNNGHESILDKAKDLAMQNKLQVGNNPTVFRKPNNPNENVKDTDTQATDTLFRDADTPEDYEKALVRDSYERRMHSALYQMREALQDRYLSLKKTMEDTWKASGKSFNSITDIPAYQNPYLGLIALSSVNEKEVEQFHRQLFTPLLKEVVRLAPTADQRAELTDYMMAKHGLERNMLMAERNAKIEYERKKKLDPQTTKTLQDFINENRQKDFSGLTALTQKTNVADAEAEAKKMVSDYESRYNTSELWKLTKAVTDSIIQKQYDSGYIDNSTRKQLQKMYKNYIPLRGFKDRTAEDVYSYMRHSNSGFNAPIKTAKGRKSKADDPFANMMAMAESGIIRGNRNQLVKLPLLNFVQEHPTDLISSSDVWLKYNNALDEWETVTPGDIKGTKAIDTDDTPQEIERKMKTFIGIMKGLAKAHPDKYRKQADAPDVPYRVVNNSALREHQVIITRNGKDYTLTINANPRLAQAVNGLGNPDNADNIVKKTTRYLSQIYTQLSIDFALSNFTRDAIYSNISAHVKESPNYALHYNVNFIKNIPRMYKLYFKYKKGTLGDTGIEKTFKEFLANGGETGYYVLPDMEKRKREIEAEIKKLNKKITPRKAFNWLKELIDYLNKINENTARFTAYQTSRAFGRTTAHAIQNAKDITVNFNIKGSGTQFLHNKEEKGISKAIAILSKYGQDYLPFFNAAIQGTTNFASLAKHNPIASFNVIATLTTLGVVLSLVHTPEDDDDEYNYYNLPSYIRRNNITFRAGQKTYITIPLPVEYRMFYGLGELIGSSLTGAERLSPSELTKETASLFTQALPIDFAEEGDAVSKFLPGMIKPIWEVRENKSWTGLPIYKDNEHNKNTPEYLSVYSNTNQQLVELSKFLNDIAGGDAHKRAGVQINPAAMEYLLSSYLGGLYTLSNRITKTAETITGTREFNPNSLPIINRFVKQPDERNAYRQINNEYEKIKTDAEALNDLLNAYNKDTRNGVTDYAKKIRTINYSPEYRYMLIFQGINPYIEKLQKKLKDEGNNLSDKEIEGLESSIQGLKKLVVDRVRYEQDHKSSKPITKPFLDDKFKNKWVDKHPQSKKVFNEISKEERGKGNKLGSVYQQYASDNDRQLDIQLDRLTDKLTDKQKKNEDVTSAQKEYNKSVRSFNELIDNKDAKPTDYENALQSIRTDRMEYIKAMIKAKLSSKR